MIHTINLSLVLSVFWWLNSGHSTPLMLSLGLISIIFVIYIAHRMDVIDHETTPIHLSLKLPGYYSWLGKEIILSNIAVVKHIILGNNSISPTLATIHTDLKSDMAKVIYANSITLTPGTVAVDIQGDKILVHALLKESMDDLIAGEMDRRIGKLDS